MNFQKFYAELLPLRALILPLYIPCLLYGIAIGAVTLTLPLFALELGGDISLSGLLLGAFGAGRLFSNIPSGVLVSRVGERKAMLLATTILLLTASFAFRINSVFSLLICSVVLGCAVSLWFLARVKYVSDHVPQAILGRAMVVLSCVEKLGMLVGPLLAGFLISAYGHGFAFHIVSVTALLVLLLVYSRARDLNTHRENSLRPKAPVIGHILSKQWRSFVVVGSVIVVLLMLRAAKLTILPVWGVYMGLDAAQIGVVIFAAGSVELLMFVPAALILDFWGRKWAALLSLLSFSIGFFTLPFSQTIGSLMIAASILGLADGISTGWGNTLISDLSPSGNRAAHLAIWRTIGDLGTTSGPILFGFLAAAYSLSLAAAAVAAISLFGVTVLLTKVEETRTR